MTSVSLSLVNFTVAICHTCVDPLVLNSSLEESLAALAGPHSVVLTGGVISTDGTEQRGRLVLEIEVWIV